MKDVKQSPDKPCSKCGHSLGAHLDGRRCLLCDCTIRPVEQRSFSFRASLPHRHVPRHKDRSR